MSRIRRDEIPDRVKGFNQRGERLDDRARTRSFGAGESFANRLFGRRGGAIDRAEMADRRVIQQIVSEFRAEMGTLGDNPQVLVDLGRRALYTRGREGNDMKQAFIELAATSGRMDRVVEGFGKLYRQDQEIQHDIEQMFSRLGYSQEDVRRMLTECNAETIRQFSSAYLGLDRKYIDGGDTRAAGNEAGPEDQRRMRALAVMSELAKKTGHWEQVVSVKDFQTGNYYMMSERERRDEVVGEAMKMGNREFLGTVSGNVFQSQEWEDDEDGQMVTSKEAPKEGTFEFEMFMRLLHGQNIGEFRRLKTEVPEKILGRYFDPSGNFVDNQHAVKLGFSQTSSDDGAISARENMVNDFKRLVGYNPTVVEAVYNLKYHGKVDAQKSGFPWDRGYVDKTPPARERAYGAYLEQAVPYSSVAAVSEEYGVDTQNGMMIMKLIKIREMLCSTKYAARKGMASQESVGSMARAMGKPVEWDPDRISPRAEARMESLAILRDDIDREVLTSHSLSDTERENRLESKRQIERQIAEAQTNVKGFWKADVPGDPAKRYESNAREVEQTLQSIAHQECGDEIRILLGDLVASDGRSLEQHYIHSGLKDAEKELQSREDLDPAGRTAEMRAAEDRIAQESSRKIDAFVDKLLRIGEAQTL